MILVFLEMYFKNTFIKGLLIKLYFPLYKSILFKVPNIHVLNDEDKKALEIYGYKGNIDKVPNFLYYKKPDIKVYDNKRSLLYYLVAG